MRNYDQRKVLNFDFVPLKLINAGKASSVRAIWQVTLEHLLMLLHVRSIRLSGEPNEIDCKANHLKSEFRLNSFT